MKTLDTSAVITDLRPTIPTVATPMDGQRFPNGLPAGTQSPTLSREAAILEGQLAGSEQDLPGGHGREGLAFETVQRPLTALDQFALELDRLLPR